KHSIDAHPALGDVPVCCVGEATAQRATALGLRESVIPPPGAQDAAGLAATLIANVEPGTRVLWPRGDSARDFGARLEAAGLTVEDPIVYATRPVVLLEEPPDADAVFFASPSAVHAWNAEERSAGPAAIAIGWTTYEALDEVVHRFSMAIPLATPSPQSFTACLRSFFPSE
ncbi:MAG: uroporphyrinogen-III synthase, partial [Planctomycetota bacterium]|nr:uroporphyrinogen-III synthase [Planctomycetota bacterium]